MAQSAPWVAMRGVRSQQQSGARAKDTAEASTGTVAGFSEFLGRVTEDILRQERHEVQSAPSQSSVLQLTMRRDFAVSTMGFGSCVSRGKVSLSANASSLVGGARQQLSDLRQSFSYNWTQWACNDQLQSDKPHDGKKAVAIHVDRSPHDLSLSIPLQLSDGLSSRLSGMVHVLNAWTSVAAKTLAGAAAGAPIMGASLIQLRCMLSSATAAGGVAMSALPLKLSGFGATSFFDSGLVEQAVEEELATHVGLFSLTSAVMFIGSLRGLNKHSTAQRGNLMGMVATALGILSVLASPGFGGAHLRFFAAFLLAGIMGYSVAANVKMEDMPQLVAGFHSFVGLAAVFAGFASYAAPAPFALAKAIETFLGISVGALTFTGSVVAAAKLHGVLPGRPIIFDNRWLLNFSGLAGSCFLGLLYANPAIYASVYGTSCLLANTAIWGFLGANMVLPIGGADMPVVVSLLNACSGIATSAAGFMLSNSLLTITGALVASSGTLLSDIMCKGINRSMYNVLLGGFGGDGVILSNSGAAVGTVNEVSASGFVGMLCGAKKVVIVPGYGLAVARCQQRLAEIVAILRKHGVTVHFAIHPVAGRLPGHMNVLLAEADVPYDIVREMEDINKEMPQYDVGIVIGANDIVNPATQTDTSSPIYGMPAIEIWKCKKCVVLKRSMGTGYSGVDNPLFYHDNVKMLFGDAKNSVDSLFSLLEDCQDRFHLQGSSNDEACLDEEDVLFEAEEDYPQPSKTLGVLRERRVGEQRVAMTPSVVDKLRRMGFSIIMEAGAGVSAGFPDEVYVQCGGIQVAESAVEVLKQADVILKVNEPLFDELQVLQSTQTMVGFWNMFEAEELTEALVRSSATFVNLALVPRVSRAQKLDALTSMANIAGYRAVLDACNRLPKFCRSSVTASGTVPPARVFVIGAGVAGLSAIATAHALGAKVFANDVREAAREQVESMGAEFVAVDAKGIQGEGVGGYASEMGDAFLKAQRETYARVMKDVDVVITTAMIPNRKAPVLITEEMVASMRHGSVIVDLAAPTGGNCACTVKDQVVETGGVTIIAETNYPSTMAAQSSELLSNNFVALLQVLGGADNFGGDHWDDAIVKPATVVRDGQLLWPPAAPPPVPQVPPTAAAQQSEAPPQVADAPLEAPREVTALVQWLQDHREELALGIGTAAMLGLGISIDIPEAELMHMGYFVLSLLIGHFTVASVTPALHTPLISVTNAISGIIVVGGMLNLSGPILSARVGCALAAVFLSSVNIVGGFAVTQRMLEMFKKDKVLANL